MTDAYGSAHMAHVSPGNLMSVCLLFQPGWLRCVHDNLLGGFFSKVINYRKLGPSTCIPEYFGKVILVKGIQSSFTVSSVQYGFSKREIKNDETLTH